MVVKSRRVGDPCPQRFRVSTEAHQSGGDTRLHRQGLKAYSETSPVLRVSQPIKVKAGHARAGIYKPNSAVCCNAKPSRPSQIATTSQSPGTDAPALPGFCSSAWLVEFSEVFRRNLNGAV